MENMRCIIKKDIGPGHIEMTEKKIPNINEEEILVKVLATAVCGTDVHIRQWNDWAKKRIVPPVVIGHEFVGEVVKIGSNVSSVNIGDIVSAESHIVCNTCEMCKKGNMHVCYNTKILGVSIDGTFAEYVKIPEDIAFICDPNMPVEILALMEPLGAAVHAAMEFPLAAQTVAIVGCGPIGLMSVAVAKKIGASRIIVVEPNEERGKIAIEMGADFHVDPIKDDVVEEVKSLSGGYGVDVVLEFSGNTNAIAQAVSYMKPEGKMAALGLPGNDLTINFAEFVYKGQTIKGIAGRKMYENWYQMKALLEDGLDISKLVTHVLSLEEYEKGLDLMEKGQCGKVILKP